MGQIISSTSDQKSNIIKEIGNALKDAIESLNSQITDPEDYQKLNELNNHTTEIANKLDKKHKQMKELEDAMPNIYNSDVKRRKLYLLREYKKDYNVLVQKFVQIQRDLENIVRKYPTFIPATQKLGQQINMKMQLLESIKEYEKSGKWIERKATETDNEDECPFCLGNFNNGELIYIHNNMHKMHKECFVGNIDFCPMDRAPFTGKVKKEFGKRKKRTSRKRKKRTSRKRTSRKRTSRN